MVKLKEMNRFKYIVIIGIVLNSIGCLSQSVDEPSKMDFYIVDTIHIVKPVVFYKANQNGKFISELKTIERNKFNLNQILEEEEVYIFSNSLFGFLSIKDFEKYNYPDFGNCEFKDDYFKGSKGIAYRKFKKEPKSFILALINIDYYNHKTTSYGKKKSVFTKYSKSLYYKIVFPLCE